MNSQEPFFYLDNGILKVRILYPNGTKYDRTRWCHAGFLQDVWYRGTRFSEYERNRHGEQLKYYALVCEKLFGKAPDEVLIYSMPLGETI
jgi:hypothetical protein